MKKIKGYKAFDKNMKCRDFQYEENKTYEIKESPELCNNGFHFCENPFDTLDFYDLIDSEFHEIESVGETTHLNRNEKNTKRATNKIKIGAKLNLKGLINAHFEYISEKCEIKPNEIKKSGNDSQQSQSGNYSQQSQSGNDSQQSQSGYNSQQSQSGNYSKQSQSGNNSKQSQSGNYSQQSQSGYNSQQSQSGNNSQQSQSGNNSQQSQSGYNSQQSQSGNYSQQSQSGNDSQQSQSGNNSQQSQSGNYSKQTSSGDNNKLESIGNYNIIAGIGINNKAKGKKGNWITLAEWEWSEKENNYIPICVKSIKIDGKKIKEDTWYILENKKFKEVE